jgi:hypothetical protein
MRHRGGCCCNLWARLRGQPTCLHRRCFKQGPIIQRHVHQGPRLTCTPVALSMARCTVEA